MEQLKRGDRIIFSYTKNLKSGGRLVVKKGIFQGQMYSEYAKEPLYQIRIDGNMFSTQAHRSQLRKEKKTAPKDSLEKA